MMDEQVISLDVSEGGLGISVCQNNQVNVWETDTGVIRVSEPNYSRLQTLFSPYHKNVNVIHFIYCILMLEDSCWARGRYLQL